MSLNQSEPIWSGIIGCFIIISIAVIISNIINIFKAKRYWTTNAEQIGANKPFDIIVYLEKFLFWPKALKGIAILTVFLGAIKSATVMVAASGIIKWKENPTLVDLAKGIEESMSGLAFALLIAFIEMCFYYFFRAYLHWRGRF